MSDSSSSSIQLDADFISNDISELKNIIIELRQKVTNLENENASLRLSSSSQNTNLLEITPSRRISTLRQSSVSCKKRRLDEEKEQKRKEEEERKEQRKNLEQKKKEQKRRQEEEKKEQKRREEEERKESRKREEDEKKELRRRQEEEREQKRREEEEKKELKRREEEDKKEQKRREEEEAEVKKRRQAEKFKNFFQKVDKKSEPQRALTTTMWSNARFKPFEIKEGMSLAPIYLREELTKDEYDSFFHSNEFHGCYSIYLRALKKKKFQRNMKKSNNGFDVVPIIGGNKNLAYGLDGINNPKMKLFQFFENHRPAYYGTWRKKSSVINGRKPFCNGEKSINYEYDSDQDWEEEPSDAEECKSDEEDNENEEDDDLEENDGFFVEHAYLSSDEGSENSEIEDDARHNLEIIEKKLKAQKTIDSSAENHEQRKHRLAQRAEEWKESQKQKVKKFRKCHIVPTIFGPSWEAQKSTNGELPPALEELRLKSLIIPFHKLITPSPAEAILSK